MEKFNLIAAPFSFVTHVAISGTFIDIQWIFLSISSIVFPTSIVCLAASFLRRCEWSSVLIASANVLKTAVSGTLLVVKRLNLLM